MRILVTLNTRKIVLVLLINIYKLRTLHVINFKCVRTPMKLYKLVQQQYTNVIINEKKYLNTEISLYICDILYG